MIINITAEAKRKNAKYENRNLPLEMSQEEEYDRLDSNEEVVPFIYTRCSSRRPIPPNAIHAHAAQPFKEAEIFHFINLYKSTCSFSNSLCKLVN